MSSPSKVYMCKRLRILSYLTERGFKYEYIIPDPYNPNYLIWVFSRNDALTKALDIYFESRRLAKKSLELINGKKNYSIDK